MYVDMTACSVTHHLVDEVSREFPQQLRTPKGDLRLEETLYFLGFDILWKDKNKNFSKHYDTLIRSSKDNEKCYKTLVYKGKLRKAVKNVSPTGEIEYHKNKMHHLMDEYNTHEVLQPNNLSKYVSDDQLLWIEDFGGKSTLEECL